MNFADEIKALKDPTIRKYAIFAIMWRIPLVLLVILITPIILLLYVFENLTFYTEKFGQFVMQNAFGKIWNQMEKQHEKARKKKEN